MAANSFNLGPQLSQSLSQRLTLTPQLLQSIQMLELPAMDLATWLRDSFESNPALTLAEPERAPERQPKPSLPRAAEDGRQEWLENTATARAPGALEIVLEQLPYLGLTAPDERWTRFLAERLDARGLLTAGDEELLAEAETEGLEGGVTELGRAIAVVQGLEPRGLGGRCSTEALLLQLEPGEQDYALLCQLIEGYLDDLLSNRLPKVARELGLELDAVLRLVGRLGALDPMPLAEVAEQTNPGILPDLVLSGDSKAFELRFEARGLPEVGIDPTILALSEDAEQSAEVRTYMRRGVDAAREVLSGLSQRKETLLRVAQATFERQRAFLDDGASAILPLTMQQVADALEMHGSTVSRAVAGKYVQTEHGILPLRMFFQVQAAEGGASRSGLGAEIQAIIDGENKRQPLSDDDIVAALTAGGSRVARRTVAKYRGELGIPGSYRRRRYDAAG